MNSNLHQMQMRYDQLQDRLVLILSTQDWQEFHFWLTRRITKALWEILIKLLEADEKSKLQHIKEEQAIEEQIQKEHEQHQAGANKFAQSIAQRPLGEDPLLVSKLIAKPMETGGFRLRLEDLTGKSIEFGGDSRILLGLCQLLKTAVKQADWETSPLTNL